MAIKLLPNTPMQVTFKYGNCTRNTSRNDDNEYYYTFDCEEGKLHANPHLCAAIAAEWPSRGGCVEIEKLNNSRFEVRRIRTADKYYDLQMKVWDDTTRKFEEVPFEILGLQGPKGEPGRETPTKPTPAPQGETRQASPARNVIDMEYLQTLMGECVERAALVCPDEYGADQQQKVAVTLYMDARRSNIVPTALIPEEEPPPAEVPPEDKEPDTDDLPF